MKIFDRQREKITAVLLAGLMSVLLLLSGCGSEEISAAVTPEPEAEIQSESEPAKKPKPPVMKLRPAAVIKGEKIKAEDLVFKCESTGKTEFAFAKEPDTSKIGEYPVTVIAKDSYGNVSRENSTLLVADLIIEADKKTSRYELVNRIVKADAKTFSKTAVEDKAWKAKNIGANAFYMIYGSEQYNNFERYLVAVMIKDTEAPVIHAPAKNYYVGDAVSYLKNVSATDDYTENPSVTVDKSAVDPEKAGEYPVIYSAVDDDGNESSLEVTFTFTDKTITEEQVSEVCDPIFEKIFTDDMNEAEKVRAIYDYCYNNIAYYGGSDKTDYLAEAYRGMTEGKGDCFTFFATAYYMLKAIGVDVLEVERSSPNVSTPHYWCLVNLGTGWYHLDACNMGPDHGNAFMATTYTLYRIDPGYWAFNENLYPEVETERFVMPEK